VVLPASLVPGIFQECSRKGVKGIVLISAGFREIDDSQGAVLQKTLAETIHDVCKQNRVEGKAQEELEYNNAKGMGVEFFKLSDADMATLRTKSNSVHEKFAADINKLYPGDTYKPANFLKEVQDLMGYKP
jgi:hypothetical protein